MCLHPLPPWRLKEVSTENLPQAFVEDWNQKGHLPNSKIHSENCRVRHLIIGHTIFSMDNSDNWTIQTIQHGLLLTDPRHTAGLFSSCSSHPDLSCYTKVCCNRCNWITKRSNHQVIQISDCRTMLFLLCTFSMSKPSNVKSGTRKMLRKVFGSDFILVL